MLEKFNEIISSYIKEQEIESMYDFVFICKIINIYNSYPRDFDIPKYKKIISIEESYNYSLEFLKEVSPRYAEYLEKNADLIEIIQDDSLPGSFCEIIDGKKVMQILSNETIEDSHNITHEIIHHMTLEEDISYARNLFCEALSYLVEELQYEYYNSKKEIGEWKLNSMRNLSLAYLASEILEYELNFIKLYLEHGTITTEDFNDLYDQSKNKNLYCDVIEDILDDNELLILEHHRIMVGIIFAYYILDRIHRNEISMEKFINLNDKINEYEIEDFLECLNLKCTDEYVLNLTEESYQNLEDSFVKILRNR